MPQLKRIYLVTVRLQVRSLALSCGVGSDPVAVSCGAGSDPVLLWLWCRPAATAPIRPLAWEPPHAVSAALKSNNKFIIFIIKHFEFNFSILWPQMEVPGPWIESKPQLRKLVSLNQLCWFGVQTHISAITQTTAV